LKFDAPLRLRLLEQISTGNSRRVHGDFTVKTPEMCYLNVYRTIDASFRTGKPKRSFAENGSPQTAVSLPGQVAVVIPYAVSGRKGLKDHAPALYPDMNGCADAGASPSRKESGAGTTT
jgi:hypothetical protein